MISVDGKPKLAHRHTYEQHHGEIPDGMVVMHSCDNPWCVNPDHLSLGTVQDNHADMVQKRRHPRGETNGGAKLTQEQVDQIREAYQPGVYGYKRLAADFGVTRTQIQNIVRGRKWNQETNGHNPTNLE